jgi:DNA-binding beta-propeller fold protein YncE
MQATFLLVFFGTFAILTPGLRAQTTATFGQVIALGNIPSDLVLDESRQRLYMVNTAGNSIQIYDYSGQSVIGSIAVGNRPLGAAMSADNNYLYVANHDDATLSVITLSSGSYGAVTATISLPADPQGVEVELSGRVLICTDGSGTGDTANTLLIYDSTQPSTSQVLAIAFPPTAATPPTLAPVTGKTAAINGRLRRTPSGNYIVGVSNISTASTIVYVYQPSSTTVLQARTVTGQFSTLSMSPDGLSFMAGYTRYDLATLNALGQQSLANAPFQTSATFSATSNVGGSVFSPDGTTLYSAFNTAAVTTGSTPTPQSNTLLISNPSNLGIQLGINLPESIVGKMVITASGSDAWGTSLSGVTHLPLSTLYTYPILAPSTNTVFLSQNSCQLGEAQQQVQITNIGGGTLTFAVPSTIPDGAAALEVSASSGLAPATITFTMDPGRSSVTRIAGTNLYTGGGASNSGSAVNLLLQSPNAINIPPNIKVFMNYRDSNMRGLIYPISTVPNTSVDANQGLQDIVLDPVRNLVYITNAGYNRIEVFNTQTMQLQTPIPVGQLPHQMALGLDGNTLYIAETGGETIDIVDLNAESVTGRITLPPIPRVASSITYVNTMAEGLTALQFMMSNGDLWEVVGGQAVPRTGTYVTGVSATTGAQTAIAAPSYYQSMVGSIDGSTVVLLGGTGEAYLYNGLTDTYTASNQVFPTPITGYYGPVGAAIAGDFLLANGLVMDQSLTAIGGATAPGLVPITPPSSPGQTNGVAQSPLRNIAAVAPLNASQFVRMTTPVRTSITSTITDDIHTTLQLVSTATGATSTVAEMPDNPAYSLFGTTRTAMPARQMVVDANGTAYAITLSGLSVMPTSPVTSATLPTTAGSKAVVNATNGSSAFAPGAFIEINGTNLAATATATTLPAPTVLGGSCVLVDDVAIPLLSTSPTQIMAQLPATIRAGSNVLEVRSLTNAQQSGPVVVSIQNSTGN